MVEKVFKIISESNDYLTSEVIAKALLNQITLNPTEPDVKFMVMEVSPGNNGCSAINMQM